MLSPARRQNRAGPLEVNLRFSLPSSVPGGHLRTCLRQVGASSLMIGIDAKSLFKSMNRRRQIPGYGEKRAQVCFDVGVVRIELGGGLEVSQSVRKAALTK